MSDNLLNDQAPGFYSQVVQEPSLFLAPATVDVIGLLGEGKVTKPVTAKIARGATGVLLDSLGVPYVSAVNAYSPGVYNYPSSSYGFAVVGSTGCTGVVAGTVLSVTVGGGATGVTFTAGATLGAVVAQINAGLTGTGVVASGLTASPSTGMTGALVLVATNGQALTINAGTANTMLALTAGTVASNIWWDPSITSSELAPQPGVTYSVDMETPKVAKDYAVKYYTSASQAYADMGTPDQNSPLSLGAYAAFNAPGASVIAMRQLNPANIVGAGATLRAEISAALSDFESAAIDVLVPMIPVNTDPLAIPLYLQHVSKMSSKLERMERIAVLGVDETSSAMPLLGAGSWDALMDYFNVPATSGLTPKRIVIMAPGICSALLQNTDVTLDSTYLAAAYAGRLVAAEFDVATPMTRKVLGTIDALNTPELGRVDKNWQSNRGITVVELKSGLAMIRRSITTDTSSIASEEPSIVRSFDKVARELREFLENRYVGSKILKNFTGASIEAATNTYLKTQVADNIISDYRSIVATQDAIDPRQFDISVECAPIYGLLWGKLNISISLS